MNLVCSFPRNNKKIKKTLFRKKINCCPICPFRRTFVRRIVICHFHPSNSPASVHPLIMPSKPIPSSSASLGFVIEFIVDRVTHHRFHSQPIYPTLIPAHCVKRYMTSAYGFGDLCVLIRSEVAISVLLN